MVVLRTLEKRNQISVNNKSKKTQHNSKLRFYGDKEDIINHKNERRRLIKSTKIVTEDWGN